MRSQSLCAIDLTEPEPGGATTASGGGSGSVSGGASAPITSNKLWTTKEANACVLTALLLCLVPA